MPGYEEIKGMKFLLTKKEKDKTREIVKQKKRQTGSGLRGLRKNFRSFRESGSIQGRIGLGFQGFVGQLPHDHEPVRFTPSLRRFTARSRPSPW